MSIHSYPNLQQQRTSSPGSLRDTLFSSKGKRNVDGTQRSGMVPEKKTFKEKLHEAILQAEEAESAALREAHKHDKKSLSVALLVEGRPRAFVDFFHLTHARSPAESKASLAPARGGPRDLDDSSTLPLQALLLLKEQLVRVDEAMAANSVQEVCDAYKSLAKYFIQLGRIRTAEYFFQKCLSISKHSGWIPGELDANLALGLVYEELGDVTQAIVCHERRLGLATQTGLQEIEHSACQSLTRVFLRRAEELEASDQIDEALEVYNKCLNVSDRADDTNAMCKANYRMGLLYEKDHKWLDAMFYLRRFIKLCNGGTPSGLDKKAEGTAHTMYAYCLQEVGDAEASISSLEKYLETMSREADQSGPAVACCSLGILFFKRGKFEESVTYFERFFEIARGLSDQPMLEAARFNLGVSKGAVLIQPYMDVVNEDLPKLINWKNRRHMFIESK